VRAAVALVPLFGLPGQGVVELLVGGRREPGAGPLGVDAGPLLVQVEVVLLPQFGVAGG